MLNEEMQVIFIFIERKRHDEFFDIFIVQGDYMNLSAYINIIFNGICIGGLYGLTSSAWSFQCGALKFANFAYGASLMATMYLTYFGIREWNIPAFIVMPLILIFNFGLGMLMRKVLLKNENRGTQIITTMALNLIIINLVTFVFTGFPRDMALLEKRLYITETISIGATQFTAFCLSAVILIGFNTFLKKTWTGRAIRSVVQNRDAATLMGIQSEKILDQAFALSYLLIGISGMLLITMFQAEPNYGNYIQTIAFVVCVSAGLGSLSGAFGTGILVGVISALIQTLLGSQWNDIVLFGLFIVILLVRPNGIFVSKKNVAKTF
ncbi:branched-chain amino acid transport system permease protein [Anaerobium acetethylicum]|uniref:Branched-chain amino acid transport system permease protein n=2 Tax=Anaerobium acetethylicum TaxID=1619234 RepID=A0A1D3TV24_9FIRM|nr:branched-chain amino acid transport system permease protein [Anaerobium acetethylicum]